MEWIVPEYSKSRVNEAGRALARGAGRSRDYSADYEVISNWRSAHNLPLSALHRGLKSLSERSYPEAIIGQRLKRIPAMLKKLRRLNNMQHSTMQDIGGCRAVLGSVAEVRAFSENYKKLRRAHELVKENDLHRRPEAVGISGNPPRLPVQKRDRSQGAIPGLQHRGPDPIEAPACLGDRGGDGRDIP